MSLTLKEKIDQFKRDCASSAYYQKVLLELDDSIRALDYQLSEIAYQQKQMNDTNISAINKRNKAALILEQDGLVKQKEEYEKRIQEVNDKLDCIIDTYDRQMLVDLYILKKRHESVADKYHYATRAAMYKHLDKVIMKILQEETL